MNDQAISYSENSDLTTNDIGGIIFNQHFDTVAVEYSSVILDPIAPECEPCTDPPSENHDHFMVCDEPLIEEIPSSSKSKDLHALYTNLFDNNHPLEHPSAYHTINSSHYSFSDETLNDIPDQEECQTLIDRALILNNTSSRMHPFEIPLQFKFLKHGESESDFDVPIFKDCFPIP